MLGFTRPQFINQCHPFELLFIVLQSAEVMDLAFLRFHDTARTLTAQEANQTLPQIAFQTLLRLLEVTDGIKISKKNKFLTRTLYLSYLHGSSHLHMPIMTEDELFKMGLSCINFALQLAGAPQEISTMLQFAATSGFSSYFLSDQHTQILAILEGMNTTHPLITTPYDFIDAAKDHVLLGNFQRLASYVIDLALALPETANVTAEQIFVASCLFINDRSSNESIINLIEDHFCSAIGGGFQMKTLLSQAFETLLDEET